MCALLPLYADRTLSPLWKNPDLDRLVTAVPEPGNDDPFILAYDSRHRGPIRRMHQSEWSNEGLKILAAVRRSPYPPFFQSAASNVPLVLAEAHHHMPAARDETCFARPEVWRDLRASRTRVAYTGTVLPT